MNVKYVVSCKVSSNKYPEESVSHHIAKTLRDLLIKATQTYLGDNSAVSELQLDVRRSIVDDISEHRLQKLEQEMVQIQRRVDQIYTNHSQENISKMLNDVSGKHRKKVWIRKVKAGYSWWCKDCGINKKTASHPPVDDSGKPSCIACRHKIKKEVQGKSEIYKKAAEVFSDAELNHVGVERASKAFSDKEVRSAIMEKAIEVFSGGDPK
jgi:hypothetical protein